MKYFRYILVLCLLSLSAAVFSPLKAQEAQNNPYYDDKFYHWGFQVGVGFTSLNVTESYIPETFMDYHGATQTDTVHVRAFNPGIGLRVNFINDLRLCRYLSLRINPGIEFLTTTLRYKTASGDTIAGEISQTSGIQDGNNQSLMRLPISLPVYLKYTAVRDGNYCPYILIGGGVSYNINIKTEKFQKQKVKFNDFDYFCEIGFGCDFYFPWFKGGPEITYRIGFNGNQINRDNITPGDEVFNTPIKRVINQAIYVTFNIN